MKIWNIHFYKSPVGTREVTVVPAVKKYVVFGIFTWFQSKISLYGTSTICSECVDYLFSEFDPVDYPNLQLSKLEVLEDITEVRWYIEAQKPLINIKTIKYKPPKANLVGFEGSTPNPTITLNWPFFATRDLIKGWQ